MQASASVTIDRERRDALVARIKHEIGQVLAAGPSLPGRRRLELCGRLLDGIGPRPGAPGELFEIRMPAPELDELLSGVLARIDRELERAAAERGGAERGGAPAGAAEGTLARRIDEQLDARAACLAVLDALR